jgi:ubiquinone/menaquinone biosynthesis C-methylase UbiE
MINRDTLYKMYWYFEKKIAPKLRYSQDIYFEYIKMYTQNKSKWLDLGCGHTLVPKWISDKRDILSKHDFIVGIDCNQLSLTKNHSIRKKICGDISRLPFMDNTFDIITSNMVFEHLANPGQQLNEIYRVLSPGGYLLFHTPNKYGYTTLFGRMLPENISKPIVKMLENRTDDDIFPTYYKLNSVKEVYDISNKSNFDIIDVKLIPSTAQFATVIPLALIELMIIRLTMIAKLKNIRTNMIVVMQKKDDKNKS